MRAFCEPSPVQLNIELGGDFLMAMVERVGVDGWNRWIESMVTGDYMPLYWGENDPVPPIWYWMNFSNSDFSRRDWDELDIVFPFCEHCKFDESSLVRSRIGCCPLSSFRAADLRGSDFQDCDITGTDFSSAQVEGIRLEGATYDVTCPPLGLPEELLRICKPRPSEPSSGTGATEYPVAIVGTLTCLSVPR